LLRAPPRSEPAPTELMEEEGKEEEEKEGKERVEQQMWAKRVGISAMTISTCNIQTKRLMRNWSSSFTEEPDHLRNCGSAERRIGNVLKQYSQYLPIRC